MGVPFEESMHLEMGIQVDGEYLKGNSSQNDYNMIFSKGEQCKWY